MINPGKLLLCCILQSNFKFIIDFISLIYIFGFIHRIAELESALKEDGSVDIDGVNEDPFIPDALRPEIWKSCLFFNHHKPPYFDEIFDLPEQKIIREDCQNFVGEQLNLHTLVLMLVVFNAKYSSILYSHVVEIGPIIYFKFYQLSVLLS